MPNEERMSLNERRKYLRLAKNKGVVKAIENEIGEPLIIPPEPQIVGALGAAIMAMEDLQTDPR